MVWLRSDKRDLSSSFILGSEWVFWFVSDKVVILGKRKYDILDSTNQHSELTWQSISKLVDVKPEHFRVMNPKFTVVTAD